MASWEDIANEINQELQVSGPMAVDIVRRRKLTALFNLTHRAILLYAVDMFNGTKIRAINGDINIDLTDKDGFAEALRGITGRDLDLIIHSPGGYAEATESLVKMLRNRFTNIRCIVPSVAKSAATMLAMGGNEIVLGTDAELGPTDPQMNINGVGQPAHAILKQFELAKKEIINNQSNLPAWLPILQLYGPSLLVNCKDAIKLSTTLVTEWLAKYMLNGTSRAKLKASVISRYLAGDKHLSHSRAVDIDHLKHIFVNIKFAEEISQDLAVAIQDLHYAVMLTFNGTGAYKMYENHLGKGLFRIAQMTPIRIPQTPGQSPTVTQAPNPE